MCRREQDLVAAGTEEGAGRLAVTRRDALGVAGRQVERVDLIEGVARLALALKDQPLAVGRPVALTSAATFDRQPPDAGQEITLPVLGRAGLPAVAQLCCALTRPRRSFGEVPGSGGGKTRPYTAGAGNGGQQQQRDSQAIHHWFGDGS